MPPSDTDFLTETLNTDCTVNLTHLDKKGRAIRTVEAKKTKLMISQNRKREKKIKQSPGGNKEEERGGKPADYSWSLMGIVDVKPLS